MYFRLFQIEDPHKLTKVPWMCGNIIKWSHVWSGGEWKNEEINNRDAYQGKYSVKRVNKGSMEVSGRHLTTTRLFSLYSSRQLTQYMWDVLLMTVHFTKFTAKTVPVIQRIQYEILHWKRARAIHKEKKSSNYLRHYEQSYFYTEFYSMHHKRQVNLWSTEVFSL